MTLPIPDLKPFFRTYDDLGEGILSWPEFFGNSNPVEVEVGTGRGMFLINAGEKHPETNFLGMEIEYTEGRHAAKRVQKRELPNVRILGGDARVGIPQFISSASVVAVHVYFPDPWWKRRHRGRRIFNDWFVAEAARMLVSNGILHAWTDVEEYFHEAMGAADATGLFAPPADVPQRQAEHDLDYRTHFERRTRLAGEPVWRAALARNAAPPRESRLAIPAVPRADDA